jgi:hypothetical protein
MACLQFAFTRGKKKQEAEEKRKRNTRRRPSIDLPHAHIAFFFFSFFSSLSFSLQYHSSGSVSPCAKAHFCPMLVNGDSAGEKKKKQKANSLASSLLDSAARRERHRGNTSETNEKRNVSRHTVHIHNLLVRFHNITKQ